MATIAQSSGKRASAKAPISTHAAFPAIVALWFAALLGFGSLVLPVALLERLVTVTGIASLVPSAAPPLGFTAHVSIALAGAIAGAALGLMLARLVAKSHMPEPKARQYDPDPSRPRRPISADELGEEGLGSTAPGQALLAQKRRSLAMTEENRKSTYLQAIPLPGQTETEHRDFAAAVATADTRASAEPITEPLDLVDFAAGSSDGPLDLEIEPDPALEMLRSQIHTATQPASFEDPSMTERPSFDQPLELPRADNDRQEFGAAAIPQAYEPGPDAIDPLPFAAPSLRRADPLAFDEEEGDEFDDEPAGEGEDYEFDDPSADEEQGPASHLSIIESADERDEAAYDGPLEELGLVQLAARLGASLEKRKIRLASPQATFAPPVVAPLAEAEDFEMAEADDAARAIADFFGPAAADPETSEPAHEIEPAPAEPEPDPEPEFEPALAMPDALRPLSLDQDEADDEEALEASLSLPLSKVAAPAVDVEEDEETPDDEDDDYSSLLAMKNPFARQQEFVRVEEPEDESGAFEPAVTFPSAAPTPSPVADQDGPRPMPRLFDPPKNPAVSPAPARAQVLQRDPSDAERSLRDALATLQRMSGAA